MSDLPDGWETSTFGQLTNNFDGRRVPVKASERAARRGPYRYFGAQGVIDYIDEYIYDGTYLLIAEDGANLASRTQPIAKIATGQFWVNNHAHVVQAVDGISLKYLMYFLNGNPLNGSIRGSAQPKLTQADLNRLAVPVPPSSEQERIAAAIEEQFSRLDAALTALTSAKRRLDRLRDQGILALIAGKGEKRPLGQVSEIRLGRQRSPKDHSGPNMVPYLRAANVTWGGLDLGDVKEMNFTPAEVSNFSLRKGDVLVAEASGSATEVGKPALWDEDLPVCCFQNTLLRLRSDDLLPEYLYFVILALARSGSFARASKGVGIHHLSKSGLAAIMVEVPSIEAQRELVAKISDQQQHYDRLDIALVAASRQANGLRSSVLSSAFSGKLNSRKVFA